MFVDGDWVEAAEGGVVVSDPATGEVVAEVLVGLNDAGRTHEVPFGGFKDSGLGREGGREGLEEYLESRRSRSSSACHRAGRNSARKAR
jgi:acyl-CoA reductase-like NAD-dependent aldehyde dehydrogenase